MRIMIAIFTLILSISAMSHEWKKIEGTYAVTSISVIDPPDHLPHDSHYRFSLTGSSAKDLYLAMKVTPQKDECTGATSKNINEMKCLYFKGNSKYECHFSINIAKQKIEYGVPC